MLAKTKLNTIESLISMVLIYSNISYNKFILVIDLFKEYNDIKEAMENPDNR